MLRHVLLVRVGLIDLIGIERAEHPLALFGLLDDRAPYATDMMRLILAETLKSTYLACGTGLAPG